jgi:hypothetical protein
VRGGSVAQARVIGDQCGGARLERQRDMQGVERSERHARGRQQQALGAAMDGRVISQPLQDEASV